jgi:hypothetical protein
MMMTLGGIIIKMSGTSGAPSPMNFWGNFGSEMHIKFMCVQKVNSQMRRAKA